MRTPRMMNDSVAKWQKAERRKRFARWLAFEVVMIAAFALIAALTFYVVGSARIMWGML